MNSRRLTWLARTVIGAVVLSTLWLAEAAHQAEQGHARPRLVAGHTPAPQPR